VGAGSNASPHFYLGFQIADRGSVEALRYLPVRCAAEISRKTAIEDRDTKSDLLRLGLQVVTVGRLPGRR